MCLSPAETESGFVKSEFRAESLWERATTRHLADADRGRPLQSIPGEFQNHDAESGSNSVTVLIFSRIW
jgi:hypothetical protein